MDGKELKRAVETISMPDDLRIRLLQAARYAGRDGSPRGRAGKSGRRILSKGIAILLAALLVLSATVAAIAAFTGDRLSSFFSKQEGKELSPEQARFVEENRIGIGQSVTKDGYTVTVESALCDTQTLYLALRIEGPEGLVLDREPEEGILYFASVTCTNLGDEAAGGRMVQSSRSWIPLADEDDRENTATLVMRYQRMMPEGSNRAYANGELWSFRFADLTERSGEYFEEQRTLAAGEWSFTFPLTVLEEEIELISEPVQCTALCGGEGKAKGKTEIELTSFVLRPLGAVCEFRFLPGSTREPVDNLEISIRMKDGRVTALNPKSGVTHEAGGTMAYFMNAPVLLSEVECLELPENVRLPMPEMRGP